MGLGKIIFGSFLIVSGIVLMFFFVFFGAFLVLVGLLFIIFNKDEETIEQRQDLKPKKDRK